MDERKQIRLQFTGRSDGQEPLRRIDQASRTGFSAVLQAITGLHKGVEMVETGPERRAIETESDRGLIGGSSEQAAGAEQGNGGDGVGIGRHPNMVGPLDNVSGAQVEEAEGRGQGGVLDANGQAHPGLSADMATLGSDGGQFVKTISKRGGIEREGDGEFGKPRREVKMVTRLEIDEVLIEGDSGPGSDAYVAGAREQYLQAGSV